MSSSHALEALSLQAIARLTAYCVGSVSVVLLLNSILSTIRLRHIPTEESSVLPLLSYKGAYDFLRDIRGVFQRGYVKHKGKAFKVAFPDRWIVVVTGRKLLEDLQRLPEGTTSFNHAAGDLTGATHIFGTRMLDDPWHIPLIRDKLTKHLASAFGDIHDEVETAFKELMPHCEEGWVPVHVIKVARDVVARTSNRLFVGLPICRERGYLDLLVQLTVQVAKTRNTLVWVPTALKGIAAKLLSQIDPAIEEGMRYLGPEIQRRMAQMSTFGDNWAEKPDDMLQWIIDGVLERQESMKYVMRTVFLMNFVSIHTTSNSFTHAIYHLAARPELIAPLREEIDTVIAYEGWTKAAMGKMWKLDSFMRESLRHNPINPFSVRRKALRPFTFSDGTFIPKGTILVMPPLATHFDEANYVNAAAFDPWRYVRVKEQDRDPSKHQFITTSPEYIGWGHGKHACPGRFFAANELKAMMAHVITHYDVKLEKGGVRPENVHIAMTISPDPEARVLFRERKSSAPL
ncbi:cytochrome P450 [Phanerochaete sordida]|uniref:Cytochrome P450 n=1 Tax=Phanerochaete sordida TaxID=48140 RepID=A0A9P3GQ79_9APHY|nr:cytochrome P450 [Phanerochaete sordida]